MKNIIIFVLAIGLLGFLVLVNSKQEQINSYRELTKEVYQKNNKIVFYHSFQKVKQEDGMFIEHIIY